MSHNVSYNSEYIKRKVAEDPDYHKKQYQKFKKRHPNFINKRWKEIRSDPAKYEKYRKSLREYSKRLREEILNQYGNKCVCCGEDKKQFLAIDHINGGGNEHRRNIKTNIYKWLKINNFPSGFQILCHNCNMARGFYGYCH